MNTSFEVVSIKSHMWQFKVQAKSERNQNIQTRNFYTQHVRNCQWFLHKPNVLHFYRDCHILQLLEGKGKCFVAPFSKPFFWLQILFLQFITCWFLNVFVNNWYMFGIFTKVIIMCVCFACLFLATMGKIQFGSRLNSPKRFCF